MKRRRFALMLPLVFCGIMLLNAWQGTSYLKMDLEKGMQAPSWQHPFGTDSLGRGLWSRTLRGATVSLLVGAGATLLALTLGGAVGGVAGFCGGAFEAILMRGVDILYGLPVLLFAILVTVALGQTTFALIVSLAFFSWMTAARIARAKAASMRSCEFVDSARVSGASVGRLLWRHIYPHLLPELLTYGGLLLPQLVLAESFFSFLGLGLRPPEVSLGILIAEGAVAMGQAWWGLVFPAGGLCLILILGQWCGQVLANGHTPPDHLE